MPWNEFLARYDRLIQPAWKTVVILLLTVVVAFVLRRVLVLLQPRVPLPPVLHRPLARLVHFTVYGFAAYLVLTVWGLPLNTLLGMIGALLAMVAIGFVAVWSLLSNLMAAFVLTAFRPFRIGDEVEFVSDGVKGKVVDLTLLFTSLQSADGDYYRVPNNMFFQKIFRCRPGTTTRELREQLMKDPPTG